MKRRFKAEGGLTDGTIDLGLVVKNGVLEFDDKDVPPGWLAEQEALAADPGHPLYEAEPDPKPAKEGK